MIPVRFTVQGPMSQEFTQYSFDAHITLPGIIYTNYKYKFKKILLFCVPFLLTLKIIIAVNM